jgi:hypothetical protein
MPRILLLATTTGYQTRAFGDAARALDVDLVFATDRCDQLDNPWQDNAIAIRFHEEARSVQAIVEASQRRPIDGVLVVGDRPTVIAARAARVLGLPWHAPEAAAAARHKVRTRERLRDAGLPVPWFMPLALTDAAASHRPLSYPCVVKPVALSGSRGVMRADDPASFVASVDRLRALLASPDIRAERDTDHDTILVEGFIPGREYAVEGLMHRGALHVLAIFDKPDPLDGPFFEETIYLTPSAAPEADQRAIVSAIDQAATALGLSHGPVHAECRVGRNADTGLPEVYVLEVAARPIGGLCARALGFEQPGMPEARVVPLEELLMRHALGLPPGGWRRESIASGVMMIPIPRRGTFRGVEGVEDAESVPGITAVRLTAKTDQALLPLPEGASYLGFIFARATGVADVERALREAHARLRFRIDAEFPVIKGSPVHYNPLYG